MIFKVCSRKPWGKNRFGKSGTAPPLGDSTFRVRAKQEKTFVLSQCLKPQTSPTHTHSRHSGLLWMTDTAWLPELPVICLVPSIWSPLKQLSLEADLQSVKENNSWHRQSICEKTHSPRVELTQVHSVPNKAADSTLGSRHRLIRWSDIFSWPRLPSKNIQRQQEWERLSRGIITCSLCC